MGGQKNALVQIGSLLLIKVDGDLVVRNLTQRELAFMERNPGSAANAKEILDRLQSLDTAELRTAAIEPPVLAGSAALTGQVWRSGDLRSISVTNAGVVPVRNVRAVVEGTMDQDGLRVSGDDLPLSLLLPGQSAMLNIIGNPDGLRVSVALRGEGPIGETVESVIRVKF